MDLSVIESLRFANIGALLAEKRVILDVHSEGVQLLLRDGTGYGCHDPLDPFCAWWIRQRALILEEGAEVEPTQHALQAHVVDLCVKLRPIDKRLVRVDILNEWAVFFVFCDHASIEEDGKGCRDLRLTRLGKEDLQL